MNDLLQEEVAPQRYRDLRNNKEYIKKIQRLYTIIKYHYGSIYNLYGLCGPGTYVMLGPTEAGKSNFIKELYFYATSLACSEEYRLEFHAIFAISSTATINKEYDWGDDIKIIKIHPSNQVIDELLKKRKEEMFLQTEKYNLPKSEQETWACDNPILVMMDDTYGLVDFTTPGNSCSKLATKARHYGIYFVLAAQYVHQLGPVFHDNARAWICFSCNAENHKKIIDKHHGRHKELLKAASLHNRKQWCATIYITTWRFKNQFKEPANRVLLYFPIPPASELYIPKQESDSDESTSEDEDDDVYKDLKNDKEHFSE